MGGIEKTTSKSLSSLMACGLARFKSPKTTVPPLQLGFLHAALSFQGGCNE
jgi:hypothetical protein